jgi:hypothetical protein
MDERFHWWYLGSAGMPRHSSLMSMPYAKQRGNEHCPVIQRCLPLAADLMRNVAPGYTGRKRAEVVRTRTLARRDAYPSMDWYLCRPRQWRLSRGTGLGASGYQDLFAALCSHSRGGSGSS